MRKHVAATAKLLSGGKVRLADGIFATACSILEQIANFGRMALLLQHLGVEVQVNVPGDEPRPCAGTFDRWRSR